jgi:hypothetical protein
MPMRIPRIGIEYLKKNRSFKVIASAVSQTAGAVFILNLRWCAEKR